MELTVVQRALLTLVRAGLWGTVPDDLDALALDDHDWGLVLSEASVQTVEGLVWSGLSRVHDPSLLPPPSYIVSLSSAVEANSRKSRSMNALLSDLFPHLEKRGVRPVLLKGAASADLYLEPELREVGDVDIYIAPDYFERGVPRGAERHADGSVSYSARGFNIEHHRFVLDLAAPSHRKEAAALLESSYDSFTSNGIRTLSPLMTLLLLDAHVLKHVLGRGVGLRHCCDFARARCVLDYDPTAFHSACELLGLGPWTTVFESFCDAYLSQLAAASHPLGGDQMSERLLGIVFSSGNFGRRARPSDSGALDTALSFFKNLDFSIRVSSSEVLWNALRLAFGRLMF